MNLALFDCDGTITFEDSFAPLLYFAAPGRVALGTALLSPGGQGTRRGVMRLALIRPSLISVPSAATSTHVPSSSTSPSGALQRAYSM